MKLSWTFSILQNVPDWFWGPQIILVNGTEDIFREVSAPRSVILDPDLNLEPKIRKTGGIHLFLPPHPHASMTYTGTALSLPLLLLPSLINSAIILLLQVYVSSCCHTRVPVRSFCYITFSMDPFLQFEISDRWNTNFCFVHYMCM